MLKRALSSLPKIKPGPALAFAIIGIAALYSFMFDDPYICLIVAPFFALGCGRGKRPAALLALSLIPAAVVLVVSVVKFNLLGVPLVTYDHYFLRKNILILAYNDWRVALALIGSTIATLLYIKLLVSGRGPFSYFERWSLTALGLGAAVCILALQTWDRDIEIWEATASTPTIRTFVKSATLPGPQLHTSKAAAATAAENPFADKSLGAPAAGLPDIFFVLQESTLPPAVLRPGYEPQKLFAKDAFQHGPLRVHTYAGATWRTEFSVTEQMKPQEFGGDGLYVFNQLEGRIKRSIFTELKKLGYRTMVFYPVPGSFINAAAFYASIGVDEFYDPEALGIDSNWGWTIPDAVLYTAMLKKLENATTPVVALMVTINQHGPHDIQDPISDYISRFEKSDSAYTDFLKSLDQRTRKSGVVVFGDHQPGFTARFVNDGISRYLTAYEIRCVNFACAEPASADQNIKTLDAIMLAPTALERFGFTLDSFSALQQQIFSTCTNDVDSCDEASRLQLNTAFSRYFD